LDDPLSLETLVREVGLQSSALVCSDGEKMRGACKQNYFLGVVWLAEHGDHAVSPPVVPAPGVAFLVESNPQKFSSRRLVQMLYSENSHRHKFV
jgi:hypothetical protein